jgi:fructuronate reductase
MAAADAPARDWLAGQLAFPEGTVDRITPATTGDDIGVLAVRTGLEDQGRARPEALSQWVTENRFAGPRPALEIAGAQ